MPTTSQTSSAPLSTSSTGPVGGDRPVDVHVPPTYRADTPAPLVIALHGFPGSGPELEAYVGFTALSDSRGFLYAAPNGTIDPDGDRFWNANAACCDLYASGVDDATYLSHLITEIEQRYTIDPKRVYLFGHSNGAFMAYRMACDHADQIAAVVALSGAMLGDVASCKPSMPVSVLEIHGTEDSALLFEGGTADGWEYSSAATTAADWATFDGCLATSTATAPPLDVDSTLAGDETTVTSYDGCRTGGHAELWTVNGGGHLPTLSATFASDVVQFLYDHPRP